MRTHEKLLTAMIVFLPVLARGQAGPPAQYFASDGVRIRYVDQGQGPPVLLVHGLSVNVELNWGINGVLDTLAQQYRVIALDLRGHGLSEKPREASAYGAHYVQDLVNLLDHLQIARAHVVGYSLGAAITTQFLVTHPERLVSVVLGGGGWVRAGERRPAVIQGWLEGLERAARDGTPVYDVMRLPGWPDFPPPVVAMVNRNDPAALAASIRGDSALIVAASGLRANTIPVLAIVGENDELAKPMVDNMATVMSKLTVRVIPGADHLSAVNHPLFLQATLEFLRAHTPARAGGAGQGSR